MSTPIYRGAQQPIAARDGFLGRLASYFGGSGTPAYAGSGQPPPAAQGGMLKASTPIYAAAPIRSPIAEETVLAPEVVHDESAESACPIDPAALAAGSIAIVIPRDRLLP